MSETPETDEKTIALSNTNIGGVCGYAVPAGLARRLEMERNSWKREYDNLIVAARNLRDAKGHHNTQIAAERLFSMLP